MVSLWSVFLFTILISVGTGQGVIKFESSQRVAVRLQSSQERLVTYTSNDGTSVEGIVFSCITGDEGISIAYIIGNYSIEQGTDSFNVTFTCKLDAVTLGSTNVTAIVSRVSGIGTQSDEHPLELARDSIAVIVAQPNSVWNDVVQFGLLSALALNSIAFGLKIDWSKVKEFLARPCGILLALGCQYALLPGVAFLMGYILDAETHIRVALLAVSCVPGGLPSNAITLALGGDINLSIVLTAIGNIGAFAMTPLWMYTLGQAILEETFPDLVITIPWLIFCIFIAVLTVPTIAGVAVGVRHPKIAHKLALFVRLLGVSLALVLIGIMLWVYAWVFDYLNDWKVIVAGITTPYIALLISFGLSLLALRSLEYAITISIETCIQNISFSFFLIATSIPEPEASFALGIPAVNVLSTYVPLLVLSLIRIIMEVIKYKRNGLDEGSDSSVTAVSNSKLEEPAAIAEDDNLPRVVFENDNVAKFHKSESTAALVDD